MKYFLKNYQIGSQNHIWLIREIDFGSLGVLKENGSK
jgi:hypothetical protein